MEIRHNCSRKKYSDIGVMPDNSTKYGIMGSLMSLMGIMELIKGYQSWRSTHAVGCSIWVRSALIYVIFEQFTDDVWWIFKLGKLIYHNSAYPNVATFIYFGLWNLISWRQSNFWIHSYRWPWTSQSGPKITRRRRWCRRSSRWIFSIILRLLAKYIITKYSNSWIITRNLLKRIIR